jgi:hypothetical protein
LEIAVELTFYTNIQIHSFEIPSDQVNNTYSKLQDPDFNSRRPGPGERVYPRAVNTFLAMLIMRATTRHANNQGEWEWALQGNRRRSDHDTTER